MSINNLVGSLANVDIFSEARKPELLIGKPFYLDYSKMLMLCCDAWKQRVGGLAEGTFLLAFYENENDLVEDAILLRVLRPAQLPTDPDTVSTIVEFYKEGLRTSGSSTQIDDLTRYTASFSGMECSVLGCFYRDIDGKTQFGASLDNYYSPNNYVVYKPMGDVLETIVNFRDGEFIAGNPGDSRIGYVRYSSSRRLQEREPKVPVYVSAADFLGKRTALFGMTRTGKSNTVKKIIEATTEISNKAELTCNNARRFAYAGSFDDVCPCTKNGLPKYKVGQIIFDMNGEYANANRQDEGTAIFKRYAEMTTRYSVLDKPDFKVLKINFFNEISAGFEMIRSLLESENGDYIKSFLAVDLEKPEEINKRTRWERKVAVYKCCLMAAGFEVPQNFQVRFSSNEKLNKILYPYGIPFNPKAGITLDQALDFWNRVVEHSDDKFFEDYKAENGHDWIDEDLKALLVVMSRKRDFKKGINISGFRKLAPLKEYHTTKADIPFEVDIVSKLRSGEIVIVDLSQGDPVIQRTFADRLCKCVFKNCMDNFVKNQPNNFIQFYFEEAHNLFPKKEDRDLSGIYSRIAKEGAKLNIGLIYATQEVSSISSNILTNTQNWFIAHLNNEKELREIKEFYDFRDFTSSILRYSAGSDKGFIRMKTYSNSFVVPVQIDRFSVKEEVDVP